MKKSRLLGAVCALYLVTPAASAAIVNYIIEGDLYLSMGTDDYSLDGAHFLYTITADTSSYHLLPIGSDAHNRITVHYNSLDIRVEMSNRRNSAADIVASGTLPLLMTANANLGAPPPADLFETRTSYLDGALSGLSVGGFFLNFGSDFYYSDGVAPLPESLDYTQAVASGWGGFDTIDSRPTRYGVSSWTMRVQAVPLPPALWLFGSGLLGLIGVARKKAAKQYTRICSA